MAAILGNPRYTGRQVWNRQQVDHVAAELAESCLDSRVPRRWNPASEWVVSRTIAHEALVSEVDFVAAQAVSATALPGDGVARRYAGGVGALRGVSPADGVVLGACTTGLPMPPRAIKQYTSPP